MVALSEFFPLFVEEVKSRLGGLKERALKGRVTSLDDALCNLLRNNWLELPSSSGFNCPISAVDGSRAVMPLSTGGILYAIQAVGVYGKAKVRKLEADVFFSPAGHGNINAFMSAKMEWLEFETAIKTIEETGLEGGALLIDGSLYGRASHIPVSSPAEGQRGFLLSYFETFRQLLDLCRERKICLVGVSKDSRTFFLRDFLLNQLASETLRDLEGQVEPGDLRRLRKACQDARNKVDRTYEELEGLKKKYGDLVAPIGDIVLEYYSSRPDPQLIKRAGNNPGYSKPLELGLSLSLIRRLKSIEKDPRGYLEKHFSEALRELGAERGEFIDRATMTLSNLGSLPSFVSFHLLLDQRDTPMKIDVPSWVLGLDNKFIDAQLGPKHVDVDVSPVISILAGGYAGLRNYNVWLEAADREVKLTRDVMDDIYFPAFQKLIGGVLLQTRGYRRVKYP